MRSNGSPPAEFKTDGDLTLSQFDQRLRSEFNTAADTSSYRLGGASYEAISIFLI